MKRLARRARALLLGGLGVGLTWSCGATCLRDSDCDDGLVCSRDSCVLPERGRADAGSSDEGSAGSASTSAGAAGVSEGGSGGRAPLPGSSTGGSSTGGTATGGRENLDASADASAASNRN